MAAMQPNPADLTISTTLPKPGHKRNFSRSPSRSPIRKAHFAARELDPLLKNLSPDSTLEALQEANAIGGNQAEQNAIAKSISDASESERKLGIRAAVAAKKLREWTEEIHAWPWPTSQDCAWGAGFVPPASAETDGTLYCGSLPQKLVQQYEDRLDEIWDAMDTLGIDEIKDYVFSSHHPQPLRQSQPATSYGRMRDFTALITATVIQSLPILANLHLLLETWSVRLTALRQIPELLAALTQVKLGLDAINDILHDEEKSRRLNKRELDTGKAMFVTKISNVGKRVDSLLDVLEGHQDSLPQAWIDSLEDIENRYADWVVQAEQLVLRNDLARSSPTRTSSKFVTPIASLDRTVSLSMATSSPVKRIQPETSAKVPHSPPQNLVERKPLLEINPKAEQGHKRGVSDVSQASNLSAYSLEDAEIIEAHATPIVPNQRISVIDHQFPFGRSAASWMTSNSTPDQSTSPAELPTNHSMIQRASTASIEVVPRQQIREVTLQKSASHDLLSSRQSSYSIQPSIVHSVAGSPQHELSHPFLELPRAQPESLAPLAASPSPSLRVDPLSIKGKTLAVMSVEHPPIVPRRSSKRLSMSLLNSSKGSLTPSPSEPTKLSTPAVANPVAVPSTPPSEMTKDETFDDKLKSILASMPTKIKLSAGSESGSSGPDSATSSRSSSPVRPLKLSPVKDGKSGSHKIDSGIRVYHLKGGRSKDAVPVKLFVRAVGENGDRVMVRVGGGWADLAEYLREYSLHHGGRGMPDRKLEVASFPGSQHANTSSSTHKELKPNVSSAGFDFNLTSDDKSKSPKEAELEINPWRPPPVPIVPSNYPLPIARSTSPTHDRSVLTSTPTPSPRRANLMNTTMSVSPTIMTTTTTTNSYTPLGGAGPVQNNRRAGPHNVTRTPPNDAWVQGMVQQARAVSGSHAPHQKHQQNLTNSPVSAMSTTISTTPTVTTTTIMSSMPRNTTSTARRVASRGTTPTPVTTANNGSLRPSMVSSLQGPQLSNTSSGSSGSFDTANTSNTTTTNDQERRKSRKSTIGDVSNIRRVFLKKKSDK